MLQNDQILHFWLDHLEVYGTCKYENDLFTSLDFDNSNYWEYDEYSFVKTEVPKFLYKIIFSKENYSVFAYYKWDSSQTVKTKDYIVVYSTAFKLFEYEEILAFLQFNFILKHLRRFDICLDVLSPIGELLKDFWELWTGREYKKSWEVETRYIWEVKNSQNKRQLIRIYNKLKDIVVKKKVKLYWNYFDYENVTRVELEVRQELAKNRTYEEVFDDSLLIWIFKNYLFKHTKLFEILEGDNVTLFKSKKNDIPPELIQGLYYKSQRKAVFIGHAKGIYKIGFCPVRILISEGLYQHETGLILWDDFLKEIKKREDFLKYQANQKKKVRNAKNKDFENLLSYSWEYE